MGEPEALERRLGTQEERQDRAENRRQVARAGEDFCQSRSARDRRLLRAVHVRLRPLTEGARAEGVADGAATLADYRRTHGKNRMGPELGRNSGRRIFQTLEG